MLTTSDQPFHPLQSCEPDPVPYILRVGVTGHRELLDPGSVTVAVESLLMTIRTALEESITNPARETGLKWKVVSALAKGADQIVASVAMEKLGATLDVVLPAEPDEYRKDFNNPDELQAFNSLFEKAANYPFLRDVNTSFPPSATEGYEQAGKALADACEILVAVWDGKPARGHGGTARIVSYACSVNRLVVWINALNPVAPPLILTEVKEIPASHSDSGSNGLQVKTRALPRNASGWSSRFLQVAEYNSDKAFRKSSYDNVLRRNLIKIEGTARNTGLDMRFIQPLLDELVPHYARADSLAVHYRKLHTRSAIWLYRLAAIAVAIAVFQALYFPAHTGWTVLEILALIGAVIMFRVSFAKHWHEKYLNYRHLAERIRILLFQSVAGQQTEKQSILKQPLPFYPGPGGWVLDVFDEIKQGLSSFTVPQERFIEVKNFVTMGWVSDQAEYHAKNAMIKERHATRDHRIIGALLAGTLAAAFIHFLRIVHVPAIENLIVSMVIILPSFASAQHAIDSVRDSERIATRSAMMRELLRSIAHTMNDAPGWEELNREIRRAEDIMSTENHEWCVSLSFRRISLPV